MGEAKRRSNTTPELEKLSKELTDKGGLIEAGWIGMKFAAFSPDAPAAQVAEMRAAFFAGAQHLFGSIMTILDPGDEPSAADLRRMDQIDAELREFIEQFELQHLPTKGSS